MRRLVRLLAIVALSALVLSACGSDSNSSSSDTTSGADSTTTTALGANDAATLSGAGSTFVQTAMQEWIKDYGSIASKVTIDYQGVGSGAGIQQLTSKTVDFAGSDVPLKPEEQQATGGQAVVACWRRLYSQHGLV